MTCKFQPCPVNSCFPRWFLLGAILRYGRARNKHVWRNITYDLHIRRVIIAVTRAYIQTVIIVLQWCEWSDTHVLRTGITEMIINPAAINDARTHTRGLRRLIPHPRAPFILLYCAAGIIVHLTGWDYCCLRLRRSGRRELFFYPALLHSHMHYYNTYQSD